MACVDRIARNDLSLRSTAHELKRVLQVLHTIQEELG
jgi:hypothetical protein